MNIDFGLDPLFSSYVLLLMGSGLAMLVLAGVARTGNGLRALNAVVGLGFLGYGFYLGFLFQGVSYLIFFKAFILPAVLAFKSVQAWVGSRRQVAPAPAPASA